MTLPPGDDRSDGALAVLARSGERRAFATLMARHRDPIYRLVRGHIGDADEALDVVQEVFVAAWRNLARYDPARPMRAWLVRIAINKCRDWQRRRRVRALFGLTGAIDARTLADATADDTPAADTTVADRQEMARLTAAIADLPGALKEVLLLRTVEGLSQAETAALLGISGKAVETRLYRARARLTAALSSN